MTVDFSGCCLFGSIALHVHMREEDLLPQVTALALIE